MNGTIHAFDFLSNPVKTVPLGMAVIFGDERFLQKLVLKRLIDSIAGDSDPDYAVAHLDPETTTWADIHDELLTRSLFGGSSTKLVVLDHADKFVSQNRERLEDYLNPPKPKAKSKSKKNATDETGQTLPKTASVDTPVFHGLLVLVVNAWLSTTRLFKEVDRIGLQIKCEAPLQGRSKNRDDKRVGQWLIERAKKEYQVHLSAEGAKTVIDLTDGEFGRMDQELQKLTLYQEADGSLTLEAIKQAVGGWQTNTTWEAIDAAADGNVDKALVLLDRLLRGGQHPLALFGQISSSLRKYSTATEAVYRQLRNGERAQLANALKAAGFWGAEALNEKRLTRITSKRAAQISQWLLEADLALKRSHSKDELGRLVLENLFMRLADEPK